MRKGQSSKTAFICESCSKTFLLYPSKVKTNAAKFCSSVCYHASRNAQVSCLCLECGQPFLAYQCKIKIDGGKFCSPACYHRFSTTPLIDRFFLYVGRKQPDGCIPWAGCKNKWGYGRIGDPAARAGFRMANRVSHEFFVGPIPEGLHVLHRCDNPPCINPVHLFVGTPADNMADKVSKGRQQRGEDIANALLTEDMVRWAREEYATGAVTYKTLADECGVTWGAIRLAVLRETWKHVE